MSQRCFYELKMEVSTCIPDIQLIHDRQDKVRNSIKVPTFDEAFGDRK